MLNPLVDSQNSWTLCFKTCLKGGGREGEKARLITERRVEPRKRRFTNWLPCKFVYGKLC